MEEFPEIISTWGPSPKCERGFGFQINANESGSKLVYGSEKNLVIRDYDDPKNCKVYTDHRGEVTMARFSHKGDMLASADSLGQIHILKMKGDSFEVNKVMSGIGGKIFDLCWYPDDKGLACGGDSKGSNARVFTISGTDQGVIMAPKRITSIDMSQTGKVAAAQLVTGTDEGRARTYVYKGGFKAAEKDVSHDISCNFVRFSPVQNLVLTVGGKGFKLNDADNDFADVSGNDAAHKGSIYACSWSSDGSSFITSSADKTVKLWDANTLKLITTFDLKKKSNYKKDVMDFQVGCTFAGMKIVSLSLSGDLNYLDPATSSCERVVSAPTGALASMDSDSAGNLAAISTSGEPLFYTVDSGEVSRAKGLDEPTKGVGAVIAGKSVFSATFSDRIEETQLGDMKLTSNLFNLQHQCVDVSRNKHNDQKFVVSTVSDVVVLDSSNIKKPFASLSIQKTEVRCSALNFDGSLLAVGLGNKTVKFYSVAPGKISELPFVFGPMEEEAVSISFDGGNILAIGCKAKFVKVCEVNLNNNSVKDLVEGNWCRHSSQVYGLDFSFNGKALVTGGGEGTICVWDCSSSGFSGIKPMKMWKLAHKTGVVQTKWVGQSDTMFYTAGRYDGTVKMWNMA